MSPRHAIRYRFMLPLLASSVCLILLYWSHQRLTPLEHQHDQLTRQQQMLRQQLQHGRSDQIYLQQHRAEIKVLQQQGWLATADTERWLDMLLDSGRQLGLKNLTDYQLTTLAADQATFPAELRGLQRHQLEFTVHELHESELLELLRLYRQRLGNNFRLQACELNNPAEQGLSARCQLQFFSRPISDLSAS